MLNAPSFLHPSLLGIGSLLVTASCTVYAPMQPIMPLVRQRGQVELSANVQPLGRVEATAAYSPAAHVVVAGGLTGAPRLAERTFLVTRQAELGAGLYQALGERWLLSALGGGGWAYAHRGYVDLGIFGPGTYSEYTAHYSKLYGQLGVAYSPADRTNASLTYRLVRVRFSELLDSRVGPLPLPAMTRHELTFAARRPLSWQAGSRWQLLSTLGLSLSSTPPLDENQPYPGNGRAEYQGNRNLLPAFFASLGVVYAPGSGR